MTAVAVIATAVNILVLWVALAAAVMAMCNSDGHAVMAIAEVAVVELFSCLWLRCVNMMVVGVQVIQVGAAARVEGARA